MRTSPLQSFFDRPRHAPPQVNGHFMLGYHPQEMHNKTYPQKDRTGELWWSPTRLLLFAPTSVPTFGPAVNYGGDWGPERKPRCV